MELVDEVLLQKEKKIFHDQKLISGQDFLQNNTVFTIFYLHQIDIDNVYYYLKNLVTNSI